jgi:hypothetical protein
MLLQCAVQKAADAGHEGGRRSSMNGYRWNRRIHGRRISLRVGEISYSTIYVGSQTLIAVTASAGVVLSA